MKKFLITAVFVTFAGVSAFAQRFAYVDSEYILKHIPEYVSAQKQLDALSEQWQKEVDARFSEIDQLYKAYQADQVLLTDDMRKRRENEIVDKEKQAKEFQKTKFGYEGDLYKERIKLIKPIQDRVAKAVQAYADNQGLDMIFDKNSQITLLYASTRLDKSNDIIVRLGYKPGTFAK
ncbi:OmpH family outer membrane protein [Pedobacter sp. BS3]|uniref:OmpH family outer membrane protein n=1 Tax=Pedobacter sp. BS3 TaxID=2567937 RepID=UPI0011EC0A22|nr:OmpH family outer membrane protein [Pedobacter sp. BS3]TZF80818.1 OmpH family outer membrane protein [Pedobacter sp. BS3]